MLLQDTLSTKKVAYGLKDCTTLAAADPTFNCANAQTCHTTNNHMNLGQLKITAVPAALNNSNSCTQNTNILH